MTQTKRNIGKRVYVYIEGKVGILSKNLSVEVLGERFKVPKGFKTDFRTSGGYKPLGTYTRAAVVHDYVYSTGKFSRAECDKMFLILCISDKTPIWKSVFMYAMVRLFGGKYYGGKK